MVGVIRFAFFGRGETSEWRVIHASSSLREITNRFPDLRNPKGHLGIYSGTQIMRVIRFAFLGGWEYSILQASMSLGNIINGFPDL
jgi:hypothetical protein